MTSLKKTEIKQRSLTLKQRKSGKLKRTIKPKWGLISPLPLFPGDRKAWREARYHDYSTATKQNFDHCSVIKSGKYLKDKIKMDNFEDYILKLKQRHPEWFKDEQKIILEAPKPLKVEVKKPIPAEVVKDWDAIEITDSDEPKNWWDK